MTWINNFMDFRGWLNENEYINSFLGSGFHLILPNLMQTVGEAVLDLTRIMISLDTAPERGFQNVLRTAGMGLWNFVKNIGKFFSRPNQVASSGGGIGITDMWKDAWQEFKYKLGHFIQSLDPQTQEKAKFLVAQKTDQALTNAPVDAKNNIKRDLLGAI